VEEEHRAFADENVSKMGQRGKGSLYGKPHQKYACGWVRARQTPNYLRSATHFSATALCSLMMQQTELAGDTVRIGDGAPVF